MTPDPNLGRSLAHFRILEVIGQGGMGVVYRAEDMRLHRHVALKVLPADRTFDPDRRKRFLREAQSAAAVTHPNIAAVHEVGEDADGIVFIAMELLTGSTLRALLARGRLPLQEALRITLDVARGLSRAHDVGIIHRDIKPDNVMVDDEGHVKILDFGLAKLHEAPEVGAAAATSEQVTTGMRVLGTPEYMSPEQALGVPLGPESDVFALGVMLYELLSGARPFHGKSSLAIIASVLRDEAPPLEGVPTQVADIVARCLDKDASKRPRDARAVAKALGALPALETVRTISVLPSGDEVALLPTVPENPETVSAPEAIAAPRSLLAPSASEARVEPSRSRVPLLLTIAITLAGVAVSLSWPNAPTRPLRDPIAKMTSADASMAGPTRVERDEIPVLDRLTEVPPEEELRDAAISFDGKWLALAHEGRVVVRDLETAELRDVALPEPGHTSRVSFDRSDPPQLVASVVDGAGVSWAWSVPIDGRAPTRLFRAQVAIPSPDGNGIAYTTSDLDRDCQVRLREPNGRDRLLHTGGCGSGVLAWSADGVRLAFLETTEDVDVPAQLRLLDRSGASRVVLRTPRLIMQTSGAPFAFLADGCIAVFLATPPPDEGSALQRVCPDGVTQEPELLARLPHASAQALTLDRDGRALALLMRSQADVKVALLDGEGSPGALERVTRSEAEDRDAIWYDERTLVFHSSRDGAFAIYRATLDDGDETRVTAIGVTATYPVVRGEDVLYWRSEATGEGATSATSLRRIAIDGTGDVEERAPVDTVFYTAGQPSPRTLRVACAGRDCTLGESVTGSYRVGSLEGAGEDIVVQGVTRSHALSPDGRWIALAREDALVLLDRTGREQRTILGDREGAYYSVAFHPNGRWVYVTLVGGAPIFQLLRVDLATSEATPFFTSGHTWLGAPAVSPDGSRLALSAKTFDADVFAFPIPR